MHELGITRNIVDIVDKAAKGRRIQKVLIEVGALSGVVPEAIRFCFDVVSQNTAAAGAALDIHRIPAFARCRACGAEFELPDLLTACACGSRQLNLLRGEEINVRSITIEEVA